jgi:hypothetical protein
MGGMKGVKEPEYQQIIYYLSHSQRAAHLNSCFKNRTCRLFKAGAGVHNILNQ